MTPQDPDFVPEGEDLDLPRPGAGGPQEQEIDQQPDDRLQDRQKQGRPSSREIRRTLADQFTRG